MAATLRALIVTCVAALTACSAGRNTGPGAPGTNGRTGIVMKGFGDATRFAVNADTVSVSADAQTLVIDTTGQPPGVQWLWGFRTVPTLLKTNTSYHVTFSYRVTNEDEEKDLIQVLCRPDGVKDSHADLASKIISGSSTDFVKHSLSFCTGNDKVLFKFSSRGHLRAEVTDLVISEGRGGEFFPAMVDAAPYTGDLGAAPTGAKDFTVERPRNPKGTVVQAADFGVQNDAADNTAALNQALRHCRDTGAAKLLVAPGTYRFTANESVLFDSLHDFTFDAQGATFVFLKKSSDNFSVRDCERVVLRNFQFDWDWSVDPLASLVEIAAVHEDAVDFCFVHYDQFPRRDLRIAVISSFDPRTGSVGIEGGLTRGFEFFANRSKKPRTEWLSGNVLRVFTNRVDGLAPGQLYRMQHYYYDMGGIRMSSNHHLTLEDIHIISCCGMGFIVGGDQQYWQLLRVKILPPADDPRRVISCTSDGLHVARSRGFCKIEDCDFGFNADDCINVHDNTAFARIASNHSVRTLNLRNASLFAVGDEVELRHSDYSPTQFRAQVSEVRTIDRDKGIHEITFAKPVPKQLHEGFVLLNWTYSSRNLIIRNSFFHDNRARGVIIQTHDVTLENNRFRHNESGALKITTGYTLDKWCEGYGASNILVCNNRFEGVNPTDVKDDNLARDIYLGAYLKRSPTHERTLYPIINNVLFENNTFVDSYGLVAFISSSGNVVFWNNTFENPTPRNTPLPYRASFHVTYSSDIKIVNNHYLKSPHVPHPGVSVDPDTSRGIVVAGNTVGK